MFPRKDKYPRKSTEISRKDIFAYGWIVVFLIIKILTHYRFISQRIAITDATYYLNFYDCGRFEHNLTSTIAMYILHRIFNACFWILSTDCHFKRFPFFRAGNILRGASFSFYCSRRKQIFPQI